MRTTFLLSILVLLITFSSGCKRTEQANPSSNNSASTNPANSSAPSPSVPQQDMNQPGAAKQSTPPGPGDMTRASGEANISMIAMDFHSALLQGDKARLEPLLADNYRRTRTDGTVVNKAQELASLKKLGDMFSMEAQPAKISGDTATVSGKVNLSSPDKTGQKGESLQTTDTFKKINDRWVVVSSVEKKN